MNRPRGVISEDRFRGRRGARWRETLGGARSLSPGLQSQALRSYAGSIVFVFGSKFPFLLVVIIITPLPPRLDQRRQIPGIPPGPPPAHAPASAAKSTRKRKSKLCDGPCSPQTVSGFSSFGGGETTENFINDLKILGYLIIISTKRTFTSSILGPRLPRCYYLPTLGFLYVVVPRRYDRAGPALC